MFNKDIINFFKVARLVNIMSLSKFKETYYLFWNWNIKFICLFFEKQSFTGGLQGSFSFRTFRTCNFIKKEIPAQFYCCEFCETSQNFLLHNNSERVFLDIDVMQRFVTLAPICNLFSHCVIFAPVLLHFVTTWPVPVINLSVLICDPLTWHSLYSLSSVICNPWPILCVLTSYE